MEEETERPGSVRRRVFAGLGIAFVLGIVAWSVLDAIRTPVGPKYSVGVPIVSSSVAMQLAGGSDLGVFLAPDGSLWAWGGGQLGGLRSIARSAGPSTTPIRLGTNANWAKIAATAHSVCGIKQDGSLWGLGWNGNMRLPGIPAGTKLWNEIQLSRDTDWAELSAGAAHILALKHDGTLWAWGSNWAGQTGAGTPDREISAIARVGQGADWLSISASGTTSYGIRRDGTIWHWGSDTFKHKPGPPIPNLLDTATNWISVSAGWGFALGLKDDGSIWIYGNSARALSRDFASTAATTFQRLGSDWDWDAIVSGPLHFLARKRDGSWWACGSSESGQLGLEFRTAHFFDPRGTKLQRVPFPLQAESLVALKQTTIAVGPDGAIWSWGTRLGVPATTNLLSRVIGGINRISKSAGFGGVFPLPPKSPIDLTPRLVWQWPSTNAP